MLHIRAAYLRGEFSLLLKDFKLCDLAVQFRPRFYSASRFRNVREMKPFFLFIVLLRLSLATAANFTQVFEWPDGMDFEWPSEAKRTQALKYGTYKPEKIVPIFIAVYTTRIFLSLEKNQNIPVTLVSLPTSNASSASPKLTPFPPREMHEKGGCNKIEEARGLQVDSVGRLWVLDSGSNYCNAKLRIFDLSNNDQTELIHRFPFRDNMHDLALEETSNGTLAYIAYYGERNIVVFSLERKESWIVQTPGNRVYSVALSPKEEPRKLYLSNWNSDELFLISVGALRKGTPAAHPTLIGKWAAKPYKLLMDNHGTMFAAFGWKYYLSSCKSFHCFQAFEEQRFHEVENLGTFFPFTFALDSSGTFWMTELNKTATKPRYRLLKAAVGELSITTSSPTTTSISPKTEPKPASLSFPTTTTTTPESTPLKATTSTRTQNATEKVENYTQLSEFNHTTPVSLSIPTTTKSWTPAEENAATEVQESSSLTENSHQYRLINIILICSIAFCVVCFSLIIFWFILRIKKKISLLQNTNEAQPLFVFRDNNEVQFEEVTYTTRPPPPHPLLLMPTSRRFFSARELSESDANEAKDFGEIWSSSRN